MTFEHFKLLAKTMFEPDGEGGIEERYRDIRAVEISPLVQAYVGDAYFHLFVRTRLLSYERSKVEALHSFSAKIVSAVWQAKAYRTIEKDLTEEEKDFFRRGRNAKSRLAKSASVADYHTSTGFEALLGSLYLEKKYDRLEKIAEAAFQAIVRDMIDNGKE